MNVWLLYPDRDFDPQTVPLPLHEALVQDLGLEAVFSVMARGDRFLERMARQVLLAPLADPAEIRYRQDVLRDCLNQAEIVRALYRIPIQAIENKQKHWLGIFSRYPGGILSSAVQWLEMLLAMLRDLRRLADENAARFESAGFRRLFAMIQRELSEDYFNEVEAHLRALKFPGGVLMSAELGPGNEGRNYILRKPNDREANWF